MLLPPLSERSLLFTGPSFQFVMLLLTSLLRISCCGYGSDRYISLRRNSPTNSMSSCDQQVQQQKTTATGTVESLFFDATAHFALDLYKLQASKETGNVFFSPFSVNMALAMTLAGAKGQTAEEMKSTLKLNYVCMDADIHLAFKTLMKNLMDLDQSSVSLELANRMYVQKNYPLLEDFQNTLQEHYLSSAATVDFAGKTDEVRQEINGWVEERTRDKIKELIKAGVLDTLTRLVLVNAIYFKGNWDKQFDPSKTGKEDFIVDEKTTVSVDMMHQKGRFPFGYNKELDCAVLELPYVGHKLSMLLVLPNDVNGLDALETKLSVNALKTLMGSMHTREVLVTIPKFRMEDEMSLKEILSTMGMPAVFNPRTADLSGITGSNDLFVSAVVHKAFVEVNEEGTEAAAATAVVITMRALVIPPEFNANHPFLLLIHDNDTKTILFLGRVVNPLA